MPSSCASRPTRIMTAIRRKEGRITGSRYTRPAMTAQAGVCCPTALRHDGGSVGNPPSIGAAPSRLRAKRREDGLAGSMAWPWSWV